MTEGETPGLRDEADERMQLDEHVRDLMRQFTKPFEPEAVIPPEPSHPKQTGQATMVNEYI